MFSNTNTVLSRVAPTSTCLCSYGPFRGEPASSCVASTQLPSPASQLGKLAPSDSQGQGPSPSSYTFGSSFVRACASFTLRCLHYKGSSVSCLAYLHLPLFHRSFGSHQSKCERPALYFLSAQFECEHWCVSDFESECLVLVDMVSWFARSEEQLRPTFELQKRVFREKLTLDVFCRRSETVSRANSWHIGNR